MDRNQTNAKVAVGGAGGVADGKAVVVDNSEIRRSDNVL